MGPSAGLTPLPRSFYARGPLEVARDLLGAFVVRGRVVVRITEVEAYDGASDPASHAFRGRTPRNAAMFGPPGHVYVYFTYGMHHCVNVVTGVEGEASAVLLRAGEVVRGAEDVRTRRPLGPDRDLARGPARLAKALNLDLSLTGHDLTAGSCEMFVAAGECVTDAVISRGPRVGITVGVDEPWRLWLAGDPTVSAFRAGTRRATRRNNPNFESPPEAS